MQTIPQYFGAFYAITEVFQGEAGDYRNGQPILHGAPRLHYIQCSSDVYYVRLAKEYINDPKGEFICDTTLWTIEDEQNIIQFLNGADILDHFHPVSQAIINMDINNGVSREDIVDTRGGIMANAFLGFVPQHVFMLHPDLAVPNIINIDGEDVEIPKFSPGSWYLIDNPEFL